MHTPTTQLTGSRVEGTPLAKRRIFIVDDHPIFRLGLSKLIGMEHDMEVCGEADNTVQALDALRRIKADVVVVDISLPGANGMELVKSLRAEHPKLPILVLSAHDEKLYALRALRAGASGFLMKRESESSFIPALRAVLAGKIWVSASFGQQLIYKIAMRLGKRGVSAGCADGPGIGNPPPGGGREGDEPDRGIAAPKREDGGMPPAAREGEIEPANSGELARFAVEWVSQQDG